jgi:hypothetical protein
VKVPVSAGVIPGGRYLLGHVYRARFPSSSLPSRLRSAGPAPVIGSGWRGRPGRPSLGSRGTITLAGLEEEVEVPRDRWGYRTSTRRRWTTCSSRRGSWPPRTGCGSSRCGGASARGGSRRSLARRRSSATGWRAYSATAATWRLRCHQHARPVGPAGEPALRRPAAALGGGALLPAALYPPGGGGEHNPPTRFASAAALMEQSKRTPFPRSTAYRSTGHRPPATGLLRFL